MCHQFKLADALKHLFGLSQTQTKNAALILTNVTSFRQPELSLHRSAHLSGELKLFGICRDWNEKEIKKKVTTLVSVFQCVFFLGATHWLFVAPWLCRKSLKKETFVTSSLSADRIRTLSCHYFTLCLMGNCGAKAVLRINVFFGGFFCLYFFFFFFRKENDTFLAHNSSTEATQEQKQKSSGDIQEETEDYCPIISQVNCLCGKSTSVCIYDKCERVQQSWDVCANEVVTE